MKKVASIAAPFASLIPGVGPFVSMGLGALGSIGGGGGSSKQTNALLGQQNQLINTGVNSAQKMGQGLIDQGNPLISKGSGYSGQAGDYYSDVLKGGPSQAKALAGPISDLKIGSQALLNNTAKFSPRGNIAGQLGEQSSMLGSSIAKLRYGAMNDAATSLSGVGSNLLGQGTNLVTHGADSFQNALQTLLGKYGVDTQSAIAADNRKAASMGGLGEGIGNILGVLLSPGGLLNKGKKSGTSLPTNNRSIMDTLLNLPGGSILKAPTGRTY